MSTHLHPPFAPSRWRARLARAWAGIARKRAPSVATPWMEEYEPRLLYSADLAPHALLGSATPATEIRVLDASGEFAAAREQATVTARELVFVDAAVEDKNIILNQILNNQSRQIEMIALEAGADGIAQISAALAGRSDIAALHILSHGGDAELQLGNTTINAALLAARGGEIAEWGNALSASSDILLYGCDVAASTAGQVFVQQIAALTGADVAVSNDSTGHAALGGDWDLEYRIGTIEAHLALSQQAQNEWFGELAIATLTAVKDTHVQSAAPNNNYGASTTLILDKAGTGLGNGHPLLQFDLSAIPSGSTINSATLLMQATSISASTVLNVYQLTQAWNEGTGPGTGASGAASWNDRITGTPWTDAGGLSTAAPVVATLTTSAAGQHNWSITPLVQSWVNGSANHGLMLASTSTGTDDVIYSSREGATAPVLVVDYTASLQVDTTNDVVDGNTSSVAGLLAGKGSDGKISLREAIIATNNTAGADSITLGAGIYALTLHGSNENAAAQGDLDITDHLTVRGADAGLTIINGDANDRIFEVDNQSTVTLANLTLENGRIGSNELGSAIYSKASNTSSANAVTLDRVIVQNNVGGSAAIYNAKSNLSITDSTLQGNQADKWGGAIYNDGGAVTLDRVTISNNIAALDGGGIYSFGGSSTLTLTNVTISGNQALGGLGGGLYTNRTATAVNATIAFNSAATGGGGIYEQGPGAVTLKNTILAQNTGGNANTALTSAGNNIDSDGTAGLAGAGDQSGTPGTPINVRLGTLRNNGGDTATHALQTGSPAINAGTTAGAPAVDQRDRPRDAQPDIGAYEVLPNAAPVANTDVYTIAAGQSINDSGLLGGGVLPNDTDADGDTLFVTALNGVPFFLISLPVSTALGTLSMGVSGSVFYSSTAGTGTDSFTYTISDGTVSASGTLIINVVSAPTATNLNAAESYTEDTPLNLTNIVISDADSANVTATLTLSNPAAGSLNTDTSGAVTSTYNAGTGMWTASGAIANVNTLLAGLTFTPAGDFNGAFSIATSVSDGVVAPLTGSKAMTGTAVNDAPTATNLNAAETYTEDTALNLTNIVVSDIDSTNVTVTLTLSNPAAGSLNTATSGAVTSTYVAGTGVWTASGAIGNVNTLLAGLTFTPAGDFNGAFSIATRVSDGVAAPLTGSKAFTGVAVNDAPTATNLNAAETYTEDTALNLTNIVVSDIDSANVTVTLTLSNPAAGSLSTATSGAVTSTYVAGTGVWTASGAIGNVNTLLAGLTFTPAGDFNGGFSIVTSVSDGVAAPLTGSKAITGTAVNDAPTATNLDTAETYTEDTTHNLTDIVIADIDSASVTATLTLSNPAAGSLNTGTSGAVTSTYNAGTGVWTASGAIANVNALLAGLTFNPAANFNGSFTMATSVTDGVAASLTGTKAITGTAVNDAPTATNLNRAETYTEDTARNLFNIVISDVDSASVTATLTLSNPAAGSLNTGTSGAVTSTYNAITGVWTASGAIANVNTLLAGVTLNPAANFNGSFTIATSVTDGVASPLTGTKPITGTAVNDAPTATNLGAVETYTEDSALDLTNIVISDIDSATVTVTLTLSNPAAGSLSTATAGAVTSTYNAITGVWTASGAIANVNTLLAGVTLNPAANFNGSFTIATSVTDGVATPLTGTKAITGTAVNDAPTATNLSTAETYVRNSALNLIDIQVTDPDGPVITATLTLSDVSAGSLNTATSGAVTSTFAAGVWNASGAPGDVNTLLAGLTFTPSLNYLSPFTIATSIDDGVAAAVTGAKSMSGVFSNLDPSASNLSTSETYTEDTPLNLTDIVISDADSPNVTATLTLSNSAAGSLSTATSGTVTSTYDSATGVWIANGAIADVNALLAGLTFDPAADFNGAFTIATSVSDGVAAPITGAKVVNGIAVNDPPVTTPVTLAAINEDSGARLITQAELLANATDVDGPALIAANLAVSSGAGTLVDNGNGTWSYIAAANDDTAVGFSYTVGDGTLTTPGSANLDLTPVNDAPVSTAVTLAAINEDSGARLITQAELLANATDVDGPALTAENLAISSGAGTLADNGDGTWNYTPALNDDSAVSFSYTASDGTLSATSSASLDITPVNDAPVAVGDIVAGTEDVPAVIAAAVLAGNDLDADGNPLLVTAVGNALNGTVTLAAGVVTFTPNSNFNGTARYEYTVSDGALTATGLVTVNVVPVNDAPASTPVTLAAINEDGGARVITQAELLANATDADGPALSASGMTIASGAGTLIDNGNGTWTYTPALNDDTAVTFAYTVSDGSLSVAGSASLDITPVNDAPVNAVPGPQTVNEDTVLAFSGANAVSVSDVEGNLAAVSLAAGNGTLNITLAGGATISAGTNNSNALTLSGTPAQINAALATLIYQAVLNFNGADALTVISTDSAGVPLSDSDSVIIAVAPVNDVALISGVAAGAVTEDAAPVTLSSSGTLTITDADAGEAVFTAQAGTAGSFGTFTLNSNGAWRYDATNNQNAIQQLAAGATLSEVFSVSSVDGTAVRSVLITIIGANDVALIGGTAAGNVIEDSAPLLGAGGMLSIADADSGQSAFLAQTNTAGAYGVFTVNATGAWTYTASNNQAAIQQLAAGAALTETFNVTSADGSATQTVVVTVTGANDAPSAADRSVSTIGTASYVLGIGDFGFTDTDGDSLAKVRITALPGAGTLLLGSAAVALNQEILAADIAAGRLQFVPGSGLTSPASAIIGFQVSDGAAYSAASNTLSVQVTPGQLPAQNPVVVPPPVATTPEAPSAPVAAPAATAPAPNAGNAVDIAVAQGAGVETALTAATLPDGGGVQQGTPGFGGVAEEARSRVAALATQLLAPGGLTISLGLDVTQINFDPLRAAEAVSVAERTAAATASTAFVSELNRLRESTQAAEELERNVIVSSVAAGAGMSVGYVLWLLRGGLLLSSLLSSLPAWRFVDPLPVLGRLSDEDDEEDEDDSVESMVRGGEAGGGNRET